MRTIPYWIQRADLSSTEHEPVELAGGIRAFDSHDWRQELALQSQLEAAGEECCPPGIGFVDPDGPLLHICPTDDEHALVHYHYTENRKALGLIPISRSTVRSKPGIQNSEIREVIRFFFEEKHEWLLERLSKS